MRFGKNCEIWARFVKFGKNCEIWLKLCCLYCEKLTVGSGRISVGCGRLSGWMDKTGMLVGLMGGQVRWVGRLVVGLV